MNRQVANFQRCKAGPVYYLLNCTTVLSKVLYYKIKKCFPYFLCFFFMYYLCEMDHKPITIQYRYSQLC